VLSKDKIREIFHTSTGTRKVRNIGDLSSGFTIIVAGEPRFAVLNGAANANSYLPGKFAVRSSQFAVRRTSFPVDDMPPCNGILELSN